MTRLAGPVSTVALAAILVAATASAQTPLSANVAQSVGGASVKIGGLSPQRAFSESADGKAAIARLSALRDQKTRELDQKHKTLASQEQSFAQTQGGLTESIRAERLKDLERFRLDIQRFIEDAQAEFLGVQRAVETAFVSKLQPAIDKVATAKGLSLVFNLDAPFIAWFDTITDITPDVVQQLAGQ